MTAGILWWYFCQRTPVFFFFLWNDESSPATAEQYTQVVSKEKYLMIWQMARQFVRQHIADVPGEHQHGAPDIRDQVWAPTSRSITCDYQRSPNQSVSCLTHASHIRWFIPSSKYRVCWLPHVYVYVGWKEFISCLFGLSSSSVNSTTWTFAVSLNVSALARNSSHDQEHLNCAAEFHKASQCVIMVFNDKRCQIPWLILWLANRTSSMMH